MPTALPIERNSVARLDLSPENSGIFTPGIESIEFSQAQLRRFNELAQQLNEDMEPLSADQVAGVARRVLRTHAAGGESPFIRSRLRRAAEIRQLRGDPRWRCPEHLATGMDALIAYLDQPDSLFPNAVPVIGLLDDALLVDIAMDALRDELDEYAEFRRHLASEADRLGVAADSLDISREAWRKEVEDELRLERQLRRTRASSFTSAGVMERVFRVC